MSRMRNRVSPQRQGPGALTRSEKKVLEGQRVGLVAWVPVAKWWRWRPDLHIQ